MADLEKFVQHVHGNHVIPNTVLVDCTADSVIASHYDDWLRKGIHVITPNKKANSGPLSEVHTMSFRWLLCNLAVFNQHNKISQLKIEIPYQWQMLLVS